MLNKQKVILGVTFLVLGQFAIAQSYSPPVTVHYSDNNRGYAEGSLGGSRNSQNDVEYFTCMLDHVIEAGGEESSLVSCFARDAQGVSASCTSDDEAMVEGLKGISTDSMLRFSFNASGQCTSTSTYKSSSLVPKN